MKKIRNLIIGAGPAGLAVAGRLSHQGKSYEIIEKHDAVGWAWRNHYDRLHLHTVKQLSELPHFPFPEDYPLYVPRAQVVEYLEAYADHFNIKPHFNTEVKSLKKVGESWHVETEAGEHYDAKNVVIATGINRTPNVPVWEGQENFKGDIIHSREYKNPKAYVGKKVLVVGMGNTGAEVAFDLSEYDVETTIAVRNPINIVPRDLNGRPVQLTAKKLQKLPFGLGDWLGTQIRKVYFGDLTKFNIPQSSMSPVEQLMKTGKTPVIDIGTVKAIKEGKIKVIRNIDRFEANGIISDGQLHQIDSVILATGYRPDLHDFVEDLDGSLDQYNCPKSSVGSGPLKGLFFVGYDNYKTGGILGTIQEDSERVVIKLV